MTDPYRNQWTEGNEELTYQFGPWVMAKWKFAALSNRANPIDQQGRPCVLPHLVLPIVYQQYPDDGSMSRNLLIDRKVIRYIPYRGKRHFIDLSVGSFNKYLSKFSAKTRNTLKRKLRRFAQSSGRSATIDFRCYAKPEEMSEFRQHAISISAASYQKRIGWGFPETDDFETHLIEEARKGQVCGFVLMHCDKPAAYVFCRVKRNILIYTLVGYDQKFASLSPGTVLLYKIIERCFDNGGLYVFDFGGQDWGYKELFGTSFVNYARVIWFPVTAKNLILVLIHYLLQKAWQAAGWMKEVLISGGRSARALAALSSLRRRSAE